MAAGFLVLSRTTVGSSDESLLLPLAICGIGAGHRQRLRDRAGDPVGRAGADGGGGGRVQPRSIRRDGARRGDRHLDLPRRRCPPDGTTGRSARLADREQAAEESAGVDVPTADELALGGDAFERAPRPTRRGPAGPVPSRGRTATRSRGSPPPCGGRPSPSLCAAVVSGWLLRGGPQPRQSSSGVRSREPGEGQRHRPAGAGRRVGAAHHVEHGRDRTGRRSARAGPRGLAPTPASGRGSRGRRRPARRPAGGGVTATGSPSCSRPVAGMRSARTTPVSLEAWRSHTTSWWRQLASTRASSPEANRRRTSAWSSTTRSSDDAQQRRHLDGLVVAGEQQGERHRVARRGRTASLRPTPDRGSRPTSGGGRGCAPR